MTDRTIREIGKRFTLTEDDMGALSCLKVGPMKFNIRSFRIDGVGHLSTMTGSAMMGLMRMDTVIISPEEKDAPLFSYDRIFAMGNDTFILEFYDTMVSKENPSYIRYMDLFAGEEEKLEDIPHHDLGKHWYDPIKLPQSVSKRTKKMKERMDNHYISSLDLYLEMLSAVPSVDKEGKTAKTREYVDGLFSNGGPSTDNFVKALGKETARSLFGSFIFGTEAT